MEKVVNLAKRRGFIFQSSEIYGGLASCWDYGPLGVELKRNIKDAWWREMVQTRDDIVGLDCVDPHAPAGLGGLRPRRRLHRPAGRLQGVQATLPRRPAHGRAVPAQAVEAPGRVRRRAHRGAAVQPDVQDLHGPGRGHGERRLPAAGDRAGHLRQLRERAEHRRARRCRSASPRSASRSATRSRPATSSSAPASSSRWRWSSSSSRARTRSGTSTGSTSALGWYHKLGIRPENLRLRAARQRRAGALRQGLRRRRVPVPVRLVGARGHRQPHRLRPEAPRRVQRQGPAATSTRRRASASSRTSSSRRPAPTARRWPSWSTPTTRTRRKARRAPCCASTRGSRRSRPPSSRCCARTASRRRRRRSATSCARRFSVHYDQAGVDRPALPAPGRDRHAVGITVDHQTMQDDTVTAARPRLDAAGAHPRWSAWRTN